MSDTMARLNKKLIQQRARELGEVENPRQFETFMGWNAPHKAARIYNATTTKPELDTLEELAFKLNLSPNELILPSGRKRWPQNVE